METKTDLSGKSSEELASLKNQLNSQLNESRIKRLELNKIIRESDKDFEKIDKELKQIEKEIKRREDIEEAKYILSPEILAIEGFELLSEDELLIITTNMDRTDYRKHGNYPRYLDLDRICKEVIDMKKKYPKWILTSLARGGQNYILPPHTFYRYQYKDEHGCHFNLGGINVYSR